MPEVTQVCDTNKKFWNPKMKPVITIKKKGYAANLTTLLKQQ